MIADFSRRQCCPWRQACLTLFVSLACLWEPFGAVASPPPGTRLLLFIGSNTLGDHAVPSLAQAYLETKKKATGVTVSREGEIIFVAGKQL